MKEVGPQYKLFDVYQWLRAKISAFAPENLDIETGITAHYRLPDFRLSWHGIRIIGLFPRPKSVDVLIEYDKFLGNRAVYDPRLIDPFEDAVGALIVNKNRLLVVRSLSDIDEEYVDTFLKLGMQLYLDEIRRRHPELDAGLMAGQTENG